MKNLNPKIAALLLMLFLAAATSTQAQTTDAKTLVTEGVKLNDNGQYDQALAKYKEAIKADPNYSSAYYETGYTLFNTGKEQDAIPYLEKFLKISPQSAGGYDMLGSIYDDMSQTDKALEYYKKGVEIDPSYQRLHYNLAITYYRQKRYAEAEPEAKEAIRLDPKHASSQRIYGINAYALGKRGPALLSLCSFLLLEPQTKRSPEAYGYIKKIINYGIKWTDSKSVTISVSPNDMGSGNFMMPMAVTAATDKKGVLSPVDSVQYQLTELFKIGNNIVGGDKADAFMKKYYAAYFEALAASGNMPAFTRFISVSVYPDDNLKWFKEHDKDLNNLDAWVRTTERSF